MGFAEISETRVNSSRRLSPATHPGTNREIDELAVVFERRLEHCLLLTYSAGGPADMI
jgi:hypothetical protein